MNILLQDFRVYFRQFPLSRAFRFTIARIINLVFDSSSRSSYSLFGEDRILPIFLPVKNEGFYVEVGANHPLSNSNTLLLYKRGWKGITIDPNTKLVSLHKKLRPNDIQMQSFVSDSNLDIEFVEFEDDLFSSASPKHIAKWQKELKIKQKNIIKSMPLTEILDFWNVPLNFDLLCIDAEGTDLSVLRSLDLLRYHPSVVLIEMEDYEFNAECPIFMYLNNQGYRMRAFDGFNGYFTRIIS